MNWNEHARSQLAGLAIALLFVLNISNQIDTLGAEFRTEIGRTSDRIDTLGTELRAEIGRTSDRIDRVLELLQPSARRLTAQPPEPGHPVDRAR